MQLVVLVQLVRREQQKLEHCKKVQVRYSLVQVHNSWEQVRCSLGLVHSKSAREHSRTVPRQNCMKKRN